MTMEDYKNYYEIKPYLEKLLPETLELVELIIDNNTVINTNKVNNKVLNISEVISMTVIIEEFFNQKKSKSYFLIQRKRKKH